MTTWPEPKTGIPEGSYTFTLNREPELQKFQTSKGESRRLVLFVVGNPGEHSHKESFVPWDPRYDDLCRALNVQHGRDITMEGAEFDAEIIYEDDKSDPSKSWPRLRNIRPVTEGVPKGRTAEEDDIPF